MARFDINRNSTDENNKKPSNSDKSQKPSLLFLARVGLLTAIITLVVITVFMLLLGFIFSEIPGYMYKHYMIPEYVMLATYLFLASIIIFLIIFIRKKILKKKSNTITKKHLIICLCSVSALCLILLTLWFLFIIYPYMYIPDYI